MTPRPGAAPAPRRGPAAPFRRLSGALRDAAGRSPWPRRPLGLFLLPAALFFFAAPFLPGDGPKTGATAVLQALILGGFAVFAWRRRLPPFAPFPLRKTLLWGLAVFAAMPLVSALWTAAMDAWNAAFPALALPPPAGTPPWIAFDPAGRLLFLVSALLLAPASEELLFRGVLQPLGVRAAGPAAGTALSALAFALAHASPADFPPLCLLGVLLSCAAADAGLRPAILLHAAYNLAVLSVPLAAG